MLKPTKKQSKIILQNIDDLSISTIKQILQNIHEKRQQDIDVLDETIIGVIQQMHTLIYNLYDLQSQTAHVFDINLDRLHQQTNKSESTAFLRLEHLYQDTKNRSEKLAIQHREIQQRYDELQKQHHSVRQQNIEANDLLNYQLIEQQSQISQLYNIIKQQSEQLKQNNEIEKKQSQETKMDFLNDINKHLSTISQLRREKNAEQSVNLQLSKQMNVLKQQINSQQQSINQIRINHEEHIKMLTKEINVAQQKYNSLNNEVEQFLQNAADKIFLDIISAKNQQRHETCTTLEQRVTKLLNDQMTYLKHNFEEQQYIKQKQFDLMQQELTNVRRVQIIDLKQQANIICNLEETIHFQSNKLQEYENGGKGETQQNMDQSTFQVMKQLNQQLQNDNKYLRQQIDHLTKENDSNKDNITQLETQLKEKQIQSISRVFQMKIPESPEQHFKITNKNYDSSKKDAITVTRPWRTVK